MAVKWATALVSVPGKNAHSKRDHNPLAVGRSCKRHSHLNERIGLEWVAMAMLWQCHSLAYSLLIGRKTTDQITHFILLSNYPFVAGFRDFVARTRSNDFLCVHLSLKGLSRRPYYTDNKYVMNKLLPWIYISIRIESSEPAAQYLGQHWLDNRFIRFIRWKPIKFSADNKRMHSARTQGCGHGMLFIVLKRSMRCGRTGTEVNQFHRHMFRVE